MGEKSSWIDDKWPPRNKKFRMKGPVYERPRTIENKEEVSIDPTVRQLLEKAEAEGIETAWHRLLAQQPQCGFGLLGICCRNCLMGPCRIDPFGYGPQRGVCGATADTIVARNFIRMIAGGAAAHIDHGREIALVLYEVATGKNKYYKIADEKKLIAIAQRLGVPTEGRDIMEIAKDVAEIALRDFGKQDDEVPAFVKAYATKRRLELWKKLGVLPRAYDREVTEVMHRTHMGVDADPLNLLLGGIKLAIADGWGGSMVATEFSDVLFGTPKPIKSVVNLGVLKEDYVNIIVHGHIPLLSAKVVEAARDPELVKLAQDLGAKGINVVGMCCTGIEVLQRLGVPMAGNMLQQELAIVTGAVEATVVDVQCIMPALANVARCYHTKLITTIPIAKIPGSVYIEFTPEKADEVAREIVRIAVENFPNRAKERVMIPKEKMELWAGFSVEALLEHLGGTLDPFLEAVKRGDIRGVVGIVGCNNPKVKHDYSHVTITKELIKNDVLVVGTGCWATAAGKAGLLIPEKAAEMAGPGLRKVYEELKLPPVIHMGSCVDNSRILVLLGAVADALGVDINQLPVVGSAPEAYSEKAVSIGTYFLAAGVDVHIGVIPPIYGSDVVTNILTKEAEKYGLGRLIIETDPHAAAKIMLDIIDEKRKKLGI
ncbi:anaerobic carbon-monoxide dehydrogenase catalytic subunit [Pyrofollis japonicus]|nr:anaerobic carbon-monoxide dehydrogenase catalytic subunit [Pyrofollis japonicus]BEP18385.1 anaerobic carbon-monoxide dehydrogenase catalytic subunit [Pyrofollis japonicus]